jgi:hypothetical protein
MKISELKCGKIVQCPPDRGDNGYIAKIYSYEHVENTNVHGVKYVWVTVVRIDGKPTKHVWPSHRLS